MAAPSEYEYVGECVRLGENVLLPESRASYCLFSCEEFIRKNTSVVTCAHFMSTGRRCSALGIEIMAMRLETRKGPRYEDRKILPPEGMFEEKKK